MSKMKTTNEDTIETITIDSYTGEGTNYFTILIYNKLCNDSAHIDLNEDEARKLRDNLNEWLEE